jgi:hypothetical protein
MDKEEYLKLLDLLYRVIEANKGPITGNDDRYWYAEGLATKFFLHAASALYLSRETSIPDFPSTAVRFPDPASTDVLARAAFEAFLTFHYVFFAPKTREERDYRYWAYRAAGLAERQQLPVTTEEHRQKLVDEKKQLDDFVNKLRSNALFNRLSEKQKRQVLKGEWRQMSWGAIAIDAGFSRMVALDMYRHLCGHAHSGSLSILQIKESLLKGEQSQLIEGTMIAIAITIASLIREYSELFPRARNALLADTKGADIVELWVQVGQTLDDETKIDGQNYSD